MMVFLHLFSLAILRLAKLLVKKVEQKVQKIVALQIVSSWHPTSLTQMTSHTHPLLYCTLKTTLECVLLCIDLG